MLQKFVTFIGDEVRGTKEKVSNSTINRHCLIPYLFTYYLTYIFRGFGH